VIISGVMSGAGGLNYSVSLPGSTGLLELTAINTYTGATTITNGVLQLGDGASKNGNIAGAITITTPGSLVWANPTALTYANVMSGTGPVTYQGPGVLTLSKANTYNGATTISAGTVKLGIANALPGGSGKGNVSLAGTLDLGGFSESINGLNGAGTVTNSTGTGTYTLTVGANNGGGTFSGIITNGTGTVALTKSGTGTEVLSGANNYAGVTTVSAGTLQLGAANTLPAGSCVVVANGGTLDMNSSYSDTIAALSVGGLPSGPGAVINNGGTLNVSGNASPLNSQNFNGYSCISGTITSYGGLVKGGTHAMAFRGNNSSTLGGTVTFTGGTLSVGALPNALPTTLALNVPAGALFQLDANNQSFEGLSGSGSVNLGGGILTLQNAQNTSMFSGVVQNSELAGSSTALGNGLRGYYYTNIDMTVLAAVRDDSTVSILDVQTNLPASLLPYKTNEISVRWLGQVLTTVGGTYTFTTKSDDGQRLWVNGTMVVDNWTTHGATAVSGTISLNANTRYDIVMEYFNGTDGGSSTLSWTPPGDPVSVLIPSANLFLPGPGSLVVGSGGKQVLTAPSTYTGGTTVNNDGYLQASANGALGSGNVTVAANCILELDASAVIASTADLILDPYAFEVWLNFTGTNTIHGISFDDGATYAAPGVYGAGAHNPYSFFQGSNGYLLVTATNSVNTLTASAGTSTPAVYGTPVTLTATITGATPTGTVTFWDGANWLGASTLSGGAAGLTISNFQVAVSPHSVTAVYSGDSLNAASTSSPVYVSTSPASITPVPVVADKAYDGTTNATVVSSNSFSGILPSDTNYVHISGYTLGFSDPSVGTNKAVNVSGIQLSGSLASDYTLSTNAVSTTATITPKVLPLYSLTTPNKAYDSTTNETFTGTALLNTAGVISPDSITLVTSSSPAPVLAFLSKYLGTNKALVIVSGYTLSGTDATNYTVGLTNLASITNFPISVGGVTVNPKTYDGTTTATLSGTATNLPAAFAGDNVILGGTPVVSFTNANAGLRGVTVTGYVISGNDASNYTLSQPSLAAANITQAGTSLGIASSANPSTVASNVTFTLTVTATTTTTRPPTGTATFYTNAVVIGTGNLVSNTPTSSIGSYTTAGLPVGTTPVEGNYGGDANFAQPASGIFTNEVVQSGTTCSQTNVILSVTPNGGSSFTLNLIGTYQAQYYILSQTDMSQTNMANWLVVPGSTNTVTNASGSWFFTVTNPAPAFYRVKAMNPCQ
jgi:autotransporter-associated beta strand protein